MRLRFTAVLLLVLTSPAAGAEGPFPYRAYVTAVEGYVRSGPGESFYLTEKVPAGTEVEVYRHDPGGWCAIRPLPESFSWIAGWQVRPGEDGLGEITADSFPSRVGSQFSDIREVVQVRLKRGETVQILGSKRIGAGSSAATWYRIAPPAGEFRWIEKKQIDTQPPRPKVEVASEKVVAAPDAAPVIAPPQQAAATLPPADQPKPAEPIKPAEPPVRQLSPEQFQAELDDINTEMSIMFAQEPSVWNCQELARRAQSLLLQAQTAVERGHARLLLNRLTKAMDVKERHAAILALQNQTQRDNRQLAEVRRARESLRSPGGAADSFDGVGKLTRVAPSGLGGPRYALVDDRGSIRYYVSPAPGVNMQYYVGHRVGVNGIRSGTTDQDAPLVTAKHVTPLEGRFVR